MFVIFALFAACTMFVTFSQITKLNFIISPSALLSDSLALAAVSQNSCFQMYAGLVGSREYQCINGGAITEITVDSIGIIPFDSSTDELKNRQSIDTVNQCFQDSSKFPTTETCT